MRELPEGWASVPLAECGTWLSGGTPSTDNPNYWGGDIPWISAASLKDFYIRDSERRITSLGATAGTRMAPKGSVLFIVRGMSLKSEFRVGVTQRDVAFGQDCKAIIPRPGIDGTFLAFALKDRYNTVLGMVDEAGHGTGRLPTDLISRLEAPIPPLSKQLRIVEILKSVDRQIVNNKELLRKGELLKDALIHNQLSPLSIQHKIANTLHGNPRNGIYKHSSAYADDGTRIVRIDSIQNGEIRPVESLHKVRVSTAERALYELQDGDILINRVNSIEHVGKSAIVRHETESAIFESNMMRCIVNRDIANPLYVALWLRSTKAMRHFRNSTKSAIAQASINQQDIMSCPIALPEMSVQEAIIDRVRAIETTQHVRKADKEKLHALKEGLLRDLLEGNF